MCVFLCGLKETLKSLADSTHTSAGPEHFVFCVPGTFFFIFAFTFLKYNTKKKTINNRKKNMLGNKNIR